MKKLMKGIKAIFLTALIGGLASCSHESDKGPSKFEKLCAEEHKREQRAGNAFYPDNSIKIPGSYRVSELILVDLNNDSGYDVILEDNYYGSVDEVRAVRESFENHPFINSKHIIWNKYVHTIRPHPEMRKVPDSRMNEITNVVNAYKVDLEGSIVKYGERFNGKDYGDISTYDLVHRRHKSALSKALIEFGSRY